MKNYGQILINFQVEGSYGRGGARGGKEGEGMRIRVREERRRRERKGSGEGCWGRPGGGLDWREGERERGKGYGREQGRAGYHPAIMATSSN